MTKELIIKRLKELFDSDRSRKQTAEKLGVSRATIFNWLNGKTNSLDITAINNIVHTYGVQLEWILGESENKYPENKEVSKIKKRIIEKLVGCSEDDLKKLEIVIDTFLTKK